MTSQGHRLSQCTFAEKQQYFDIFADRTRNDVFTRDHVYGATDRLYSKTWTLTQFYNLFVEQCERCAAANFCGFISSQIYRIVVRGIRCGLLLPMFRGLCVQQFHCQVGACALCSVQV